VNKLILLVLAVIFSLSARAEIDCSYKYRVIKTTDVRMCSHKPISRSDLVYVIGVVESTPARYLEFISLQMKRKISPVPISRIDIAIMSRESLNDGTLPHGFDVDKSAVGRFYPGGRRIYIDIGALKARDTTIAHELAHLINDKIGIINNELDEALAYAFELYLSDYNI